MSEIRVTLSGPALKLFGKSKSANSAVRRAIRKSASSSARSMKPEASRHVRSDKNIKAGSVSRDIDKRSIRRTGDRTEWGLDVKGGATRLSAYSRVRATRKGVVVAIDKGSPVLIKGAFMHKKNGRTSVFKRDTQSRYPIKPLVGTRTVDVLKTRRAIRKVKGKGRDTFNRTFSRVVGVELGKL